LLLEAELQAEGRILLLLVLLMLLEVQECPPAHLLLTQAVGKEVPFLPSAQLLLQVVVQELCPNHQRPLQLPQPAPWLLPDADLPLPSTPFLLPHGVVPPQPSLTPVLFQVVAAVADPLLSPVIQHPTALPPCLQQQG
jgi:hypothetical protein